MNRNFCVVIHSDGSSISMQKLVVPFIVFLFFFLHLIQRTVYFMVCFFFRSLVVNVCIASYSLKSFEEEKILLFKSWPHSI